MYNLFNQSYCVYIMPHQAISLVTNSLGTDRQIDQGRQTDRHTDRQPDRQTDSQTEDRQTDTHTHTHHIHILWTKSITTC